MVAGSGPSRRRKKKNVKKEVEKARDKTQTTFTETEVNALIDDLLKECNDRDIESHRSQLNEIKQALEEDIEGSIELKFGGSVSKHTYVDGLSDVDVLLLINKSELTEYSPKQIKEYVQSKLKEKLSDVKEIRIGKLCVTVVYKDGTEIQLLPALKKGEGYHIPDRSGNNWSNIVRPNKFADRLTEVNQACNGKVIPTIKLIKNINSQLPEEQQLSGYHIESLAIEIFKSYSGQKTPKAMLKYFFEKAAEKINTPIKDRSGQSINVDEDLGPENSKERQRISYTMRRKSDEIEAADNIGSIEKWKEILGA